ncbi:hypothetical protein ABB41_06925 [Lactococcus lactis]|uniref:hypothetical protein n=1 Tax=Lactococcus lactis TaxID=1358 RepID=UPI0007608B22|nr:hypothetical protein [Lactococcus lactis]KWT48048.1 hypothetical protein ABB41_06925 [Lactococcus lactis]HAV94722.1 hypothetical protein [Lactococcus lactis]
MKTRAELFKEADEKYGIRTTANFHCDPNEELTDEEYQKQLDFYKKMSEIDWDDFEDDESEDF